MLGLRDVGLYCKEINVLNMCGCDGIEGSGLISFAEECKYLLKIDVSKCKSLKKWALHKLFYECKRLEDINVSHLQEIGDEEITVLALNCPNIVSFNAKHSPYVSDQSIMALANNCPDLDYVDVSRTRMHFRISDVSLLALGDKSKSLRVLRCAGCENITDVGLMWLAEGCQAVEELDFHGLQKISDAGLRSLGNSCHSLTSLNISGAKLISDIGLTSIATGCPNLKSLACVGIFQLADPRLSAPKKGQEQAWQSVLGIASLSNQCTNITNLDLSGCFRLNLALERHVSSLAMLKVVNFTGVNQATSKSFCAVAEGCPLLEDVTLSDCGKAIDNNVLIALAKFCSALKIIILRRCNNIGNSGIKALSSCSNIEKLDFTGCRSLTDIMILPISESDTLPKLRYLIFNNCDLITDTALAWIASKTHNILYMSMFGTKVTRHAVQAVRDRFPFTDMVQTEDFLGFVPVFRVDDKKLLINYDILRSGIIKLQARQRSFMARLRVAAIIKKRIFDKAIHRLHQMALLFLAKSRMYYRRQEHNRINHAAVIVTSIMWIGIAHKKVARRKGELHADFIRRSITLIQVHWRIYLAKCLRMKLYNEFMVYTELRRKSAFKIQGMARTYFAKLRIVNIKKMRKAREGIEERKALVIERLYRGMRGRKYAKKVKFEKEREKILILKSALVIQRAFRRHRTRKIVKLKVGIKTHRLKCCIMIQALMRGALARLLTAEILLDLKEIRLNTAALHIQNRWRVKQAQLELKRLRYEKTNIIVKQNNAAIIMQKYARCRLARKVLNRLKGEWQDSLRLEVELQFWAVTKIQAAWRGMIGRLHFDEELKLKKGKWKELFDEQRQRRFFYNKLTGEIRWRMPQDLLDLIPKPFCDNCTQQEAHLECAVCNELYCTNCFEYVHSGGKRRDHDFRCLYDYYGRRIDYGDGGFPCIWPSEILQDEVQGWMLRVAPIREPVSVHEDWEEYADPDCKTLPIKTFYFNRKTFITSYDKPYVETNESYELQEYY